MRNIIARLGLVEVLSRFVRTLGSDLVRSILITVTSLFLSPTGAVTNHICRPSYAFSIHVVRDGGMPTCCRVIDFRLFLILFPVSFFYFFFYLFLYLFFFFSFFSLCEAP